MGIAGVWVSPSAPTSVRRASPRKAGRHMRRGTESQTLAAIALALATTAAIIAVSVFPRAEPTYCDKMMAAAHALENSGKDEDDEMGVLETKAREALKPLVQDCLEMADELRY